MIDTIIFIFCFVDDFCKLYEDALKKFVLLSGKKLRNPTMVPALTLAEIITVLLIFQRFNMRNLIISLFCKTAKEDYIGSTKIDACHIKRGFKNKVFAGNATFGYSSMGKFVKAI